MADLTATNLSVKNAEHFVNSVKNKDRVLSFFLGGSEAATSADLNTDNERLNLFKDSTIFKQIEAEDCNVVVPYIKWSKTSYNRWNSQITPKGNYYLLSNNNVYLIIQNDKFNRKKYDKKINTSVAPNHKSGVNFYDDGYGYLYLYTLSATDKVIINNSDWIPVPDKTIKSIAGGLIYQQINVNSISSENRVINYKDPIINIVSDTGSGASIKIETNVVSSPNTTIGNREYTIMGISINSMGTGYKDFNIFESLKSVLSNKHTDSQIQDIANAIELGFIGSSGLNVREALSAKFALINCRINIEQIKSVSNQTKFFKFGINEDVLYDSNEKLFKENSASVSNNVKLTISQFGIGPAPDENDFSFGTNISKPNTSQYTTSTVVSYYDGPSFGEKILEVQTKNKNLYQVGDRIMHPTLNTSFEIISTSIPEVKEYSGKSLHIGRTSFSYDSTENFNKKTFIGQVIQRF
jgi:hypothetical protein